MREDLLLRAPKSELAGENKDDLIDGIVSLRRLAGGHSTALEEAQGQLATARENQAAKFKGGRRAFTDGLMPLGMLGSAELFNLFWAWLGRPKADGSQGAISAFVAKWLPLFRSLPPAAVGALVAAMNVPTPKSGPWADGAYEGGKSMVTAGMTRFFDFMVEKRSITAAQGKEAQARLQAADEQLRAAQAEIERLKGAASTKKG